MFIYCTPKGGFKEGERVQGKNRINVDKRIEVIARIQRRWNVDYKRTLGRIKERRRTVKSYSRKSRKWR